MALLPLTSARARAWVTLDFGLAKDHKFWFCSDVVGPVRPLERKSCCDLSIWPWGAAMTMFQTLRRMLANTTTLKMACEACGHRASWTRAQAFSRLGPDATPFEIRRRLTCSGCGQTDRIRVWI